MNLNQISWIQTPAKKRATSRSFFRRQAWFVASLVFTTGWLSHQADALNIDQTVNVASGETIADNSIFVGYPDTGTLNIEEGGYVSSRFGLLGFYSNSLGTVIVSGSWSNSGWLRVGHLGTGTLNIEEGGYVSSAEGHFGYYANSNGTATVSGTWSNSSVLYVGYSGTGTLNIESGGLVNAPSVDIGSQAGATGIVSLNEGGILLTGSIAKGGGAGTLTFNGGTVRAIKNNGDYLSNFAPGNVTIATGGAIFDSNGFDIGVSTQLSGAGGLTKSGNGTLVLTGENTYTGLTTVSNGSLIIGDGGTSGSLTGDVANYAVFGFNRSDATRYDGAITGSGVFVNMGNGIVTLGGEGISNFFGPVYVAAGGVQFATKASLGNFALDGATIWESGTTLAFNVGGSGEFTLQDLYNLPLSKTSFLGLDTTNAVGSFTFATGLPMTPTLGSEVVLKKLGTGILDLFANNGFANEIVISDGALRTASLLTGNIVNDGEVIFNPGFSSSYSGNISGTGSLTKQGGGKFVLDGINTYAGQTVVSEGTLLFAKKSAFANPSGGIFVASGAVAAFNVGGVGEFTSSDLSTVVAASAGKLEAGSFLGLDTANAGGSFTHGYGITGEGVGLIKFGTGTLVLEGSNTYTGITSIQEGMLKFARRSSLNKSSGTPGDWTGTRLNVHSGAVAAFNVGDDIGFSSADITSLLAFNSGADGFQSGSYLGLDTSLTGQFSFSSSINDTNNGNNRIGLIKLGAGTLSLTAENGYTGKTMISKGTLALSGGGQLSSATDVEVASGASLLIDGVSAIVGGLSGEGTVTVASGTLSAGNDSNASLNAFGYGNGAFVKKGSGTLTLTGSSGVLTGGITVDEGTLRFADSASIFGLGSSLTIAEGATLDLNKLSGSVNSLSGSGNFKLGGGSFALFGNGDQVLSLSISGSGSFVRNGSGKLTLLGENTFTGTMTVAGGPLQIGDGGTTGSLAGNIQANGVAVIFNRSDDFTYAGSISGNTTLTKLGAGTLTLTGTHLFTGTSSIVAGTVKLGDKSRISSQINVAADTALVLDGESATVLGLYGGGGVSLNSGTLTIGGSGSVFGPSTFSGVISGSGSLVNERNTQYLTGVNTYTGETIVSGGSLYLSGSGRLADSTKLIVHSGASFFLQGASTTVAALSGSGAVIFNGGNLTLNDAVDSTFNGKVMGYGSFTKAGEGVLTLTSFNESSLGIVISAGTLALTEGGSLSQSTVSIASGASLSVNTHATVGSLKGNGAVQIKNNSLKINGAENTTFSGSVQGSGDFIKDGSGTLTLSGSSSHTGEVSVDGGVLKVNGTLDSTVITVNEGATLGGSGKVNEVILNQYGLISPGNSAGTLITGSQTWHEGSGYLWEIDSLTDSTQWDLLEIDGTLTLNPGDNGISILISSLNLGADSGLPLGYEENTTYRFTIATTTGGIIGFDADSFIIDTHSFGNNLGDLGNFTITMSLDGLGLDLTYTTIPEPGTWSLAIGGALLALAFSRRGRRFDSHGERQRRYF